jgi:hypothetical protein
MDCGAFAVAASVILPVVISLARPVPISLPSKFQQVTSFEMDILDLVAGLLPLL